MKKIILKLTFALCLSTILISCTSIKNQQEIPADEYSSETVEVEKGEAIEVNQNNGEMQVPQKKKKNALESFFTFGNKDDFVYGDEFSLFTKGTVGGIKQKKADFMIAPEKYTAGFGSTYMAAYYIVQLKQESRQKFINAFNSYLSDFDNKRLERKGRNTYKKYGNMEVHLDWGTIKSSTPNHADGTAYLGYEFVKGSPYFTITTYQMHNDYWDLIGDSTTKDSLALKYYFTKAQASQLCSMLEQEKINSYLMGYSSDDFLTPESEDDY